MTNTCLCTHNQVDHKYNKLEGTVICAIPFCNCKNFTIDDVEFMRERMREAAEDYDGGGEFYNYD